MGNHEARKIVGSRRKTVRRCRNNDLKWLRTAGAGLIASGHQRSQFRRQRLGKGGVRHLQGLEDVLRYIVIEGTAGNSFHDVARQGGSVIGISRSGTRSKYPLGNMPGQIIFDWTRLCVLRDK